MAIQKDPLAIREVVFRELTEDQKKWAQHFGFHGWFSERKTPQEAYAYAQTIINALPQEYRMYVTAALHVMINTLAVQRAARIEEPFPAAVEGQVA